MSSISIRHGKATRLHEGEDPMTDKKYSTEEVLQVEADAYDAGAARGRADVKMGLTRIENEIIREAPGKTEHQEYIVASQ